MPKPDYFWDVLILPMQISFIPYPENSAMACLWVTAIDIVIAKQFTGKNNELLYCRFKSIGFSRKMYIQASVINMKLNGYCSCTLSFLIKYYYRTRLGVKIRIH